MTIKATRRQAKANRQAFQHAQSQAGDDGVVCGYTTDEGVPRYFIVPKDASEESIRARAFETIHGRPMNRAEELLDAAVAGDFIRASEQAISRYLDRTEPFSLKAVEEEKDASH